MFGWFKRKPKQPSYSEMGSRVASVLDSFIRQEGFEEFSKDRLSVIITTDYRAVISDGSLTPNPIVVVPLNELLFLPTASQGMLLFTAIDMAARVVVDRLPPQSN